jgi:hypothetical protein
MSVTFGRTNAPFVRCEKKLKLGSDGSGSGSKKCKLGYGGAYGGACKSRPFGRSLESGGRFHVDVLGRNLA